MAHRAVRHQHRHVRAVGSAACEQFRRVDVQRLALTAVVRGTLEARREPTDAASDNRRTQGRQREPAAAVFDRRVSTVDRDVGNAQVVVDRRVARIHRMELRCRVVVGTRPLLPPVGLIRCGCRSQPDGRVGHRASQRMKRGVDMMSPTVGVAVAQTQVSDPCAQHVVDRRVLVGGELNHQQPLPADPTSQAASLALLRTVTGCNMRSSATACSAGRYFLRRLNRARPKFFSSSAPSLLKISAK